MVGSNSATCHTAPTVKSVLWPLGINKNIFRSMQPCMQGLPLVQLKNGGVLFVGVDGSDVQKKKKMINKCVDLITQSSTMITKK